MSISDVSLASLGPHHCPRPPGPGHGAWGRSRSVPDRWSDPQLTGGQSHQHHGGSYLLRARPPLSRLGRQFSVSSDFASNGGLSRLYEPSYNYPSFHGISDSLLATVGDSVPGHRQYLDSDYLSPHHHPTTSLYPDRRKKTVRFNSVSDQTQFYDYPGPGLDLGWITIQDLRPGRGRQFWDRQESQESTAR